jgi:type II secretory pathway component PulC
MNGGATKKPTRKKSVNQDDFNLLNRVPRARKNPQKVEDPQKIFKYIDDNVIGKGSLFLGPYGRRKRKS